MDGLDNRQIILLTLLVSFVTSIATGIVTVTLVEEAPKGFTSTINKVIETTVEKVVPKETVIQVVKEVKGESPATLIATVVAERQDAMVSIITKFLISKNPEGIETREIQKTQTGFFVAQNGLIASARGDLIKGNKYNVLFRDGKENKEVTASVIQVKDDVALLSLVKPTDLAAKSSQEAKVLSGEDQVKYIPLAKGLPQLGSHVIAFSRPSTKSVAVFDGIISSYVKDDGDFVTSINTTIPTAEGGEGGPLLTLAGELIGVAHYDAKGVAVYSPMSGISDLLKSYLEENAEKDNSAAVINAVN